MSDILQPSNNPVATALIIAADLVATRGKKRERKEDTAMEIAAEINQVVNQLLHDMGVAQLHGPKG